LYDFERGKVKFLRGSRYPSCHGIFIDDRLRCLIDPSSDKEKLQAVLSERAVDIIINSHAHEDHVLYNYLFQEAELWVHHSEAEKYENVRKFVHGFGNETDEDYEKWVKFMEDECRFVPRKPDRLLHDGDILSFGEVEVQVVHTPGHCEGHCSFYFIRERIMYMADLDLVRTGPYYAGPNSSIRETMESLERIKEFPAEVYLTAHGRGIHQGDPSIIDRYIHTIYERENAITDLLKKSPRTLEQIVAAGIIYGGRTVNGVWDLSSSERKMMRKHLELLIQRGLVAQDGDTFLLC